MLILYSVSVLYAAYNSGKGTTNTPFWAVLLGAILQIIILYYGGFWSVFL
jgi:hypothetical protein